MEPCQILFPRNLVSLSLHSLLLSLCMVIYVIHQQIKSCRPKFEKPLRAAWFETGKLD
uniref:Uncharacterized protein n=1 Tax=Anguilla anguilla TaxID=7936 RepID=A0A0E9WCX7_ANGAN